MKTLSAIIAASILLSISTGSALARGPFDYLAAGAPQAQSSPMPSGPNGMTPLQQSEANMLIGAINAPVNPYNAQMELQAKQQQQAQLQILMNQVSNQKSMQEQMRNSDLATAKGMEERIRQNEMSRLTSELNRPIIASNPVLANQQASMKSQQLAELRRLQNLNTNSAGAMQSMQQTQASLGSSGPTAQQEREMGMLIQSLNKPIQNPMQAGWEIQYKQQQQIKLQELTNKINAQKSIQQQMQTADATTAASLQKTVVNNEMNRLREQINRPIIPSTPVDVQQQLSDKAQQQAELNRLVEATYSGSLMDMKLQQMMQNQNQAYTTAANVLRQQNDASQRMVGNLK